MGTKSVIIDGREYIPINALPEIEFDSSKSIAQRLVGKGVIVRSRNEGVNCGTVVCADETGIELKNCRRLYYHKPENKSLSWYEGVAMTGLGEGSKVSGTVASKTIIEDYSATLCTEGAYRSIMEWPTNAQS